MRAQRIISVADYHTEGHPARIVLAGVGPLPGQSMAERSRHFEQHLDDLRQFLLYEPRGNSFMVAMLLTPPIDTHADMGVLILEIPGMAPMCGHGTIAAVTAMVEMGLIKHDASAGIILDTPAGLVKTSVRVQNGHVQDVTVENVPAYALCLGETVNVDPYGIVEFDVGYGGDYYAIVSAERFGLAIEPARRDEIVEVAAKLRHAIGAQLELVDPVTKRPVKVTSIQFWQHSGVEGVNFRNTVTFPPGEVDRSPCGTGTCARMATLFARGRLKIGESFVHESIIGTTFRGLLLRETEVSGVPAVVPAFSGRAYIMAIQQLMLDESDPFPKGYLLA